MKLKDGALTTGLGIKQVLDTDSHKVNRKLVVLNSELCKCRSCVQREVVFCIFKHYMDKRHWNCSAIETHAMAQCLSRREGAWQTDLLQWWHPITVPLSNSVSFLEWLIILQMIVKARLHDCVVDFYTPAAMGLKTSVFRCYRYLRELPCKLFGLPADPLCSRHAVWASNTFFGCSDLRKDQETV